MRCRLLWTAPLVVILTGLALPDEKYAPLPKAITEAKSVYILNRTGAPEPADQAYRELRSWGRFKVVDEMSAADLVFVLTSERAEDAGVVAIPIGSILAAVPVRTRFTTLRIFASQAEYATAIWVVTRSSGNGGAKACIKELRKRFPKEAKPASQKKN
jgi:hypothetical protein